MSRLGMNLQWSYGLRLALRCCVGVFLFFAYGCTPNRPAPTGRAYFGPTEPMEAVVGRINANNQPIRTLFAFHTFEATIYDEKGEGTFVNGRGTINYRKPGELLLQGKKEVGNVFEIGSNDERYWLSIALGPDTMWWGHYRNLGKPCITQPIPIRPDAMLEILGVGDIDTDFTREPAPVMRFNNDADAYMFIWNVRASHPDRWIAYREIWYDRQTLRPTLVLLFDPDGRVILRAYLSDYQPVKIETMPKDRWPMVARVYRLYFPDSGSKMNFTLSDVALQRNGKPDDRTFRFPDRPGVSNIIQIDQGCGD
ncbi:MAG: hypothetical protein IT447_01190 [Phycisphaerales bacterium]|jgi:hypothetical protein|nr:hypothetical protein [Phycisphaerales bacterium]